jgi:tripartite-type tricarboxylate transporter receptor subunit TctC
VRAAALLTARYDASNWYGLIVRARTPPSIVKKLHDDIAKAVDAPDVRERMLNQEVNPVHNTREEFAAHIRAEIAKWGESRESVWREGRMT